MNSQILLVGADIEASLKTKDLLSSKDPHTVVHVTEFKGAIGKLSRGRFQLLVFDCDVLTEEKLKLVKKFRELGYTLPILLLAKAVVNQVRTDIKTLTRSAILEKPLEHKHFFGVTDKLLRGKEVPQQSHKRFYTNQYAVIEPIGKSAKYEGAMLNLSKGGAYLELSDKDAEGLTGIIKMKVSLNEMDRHYEVQARVVWNSKNTIWGKGRGVGVEFIQAKDVYRNLLNNL